MSKTRKHSLARVVAPAGEPVSLAEAKLYLRVDHNNEDTLIADLIVAARLSAEQWLKSSLISQSWKISYDDYIEEYVSLPMGPVSSITSVAAVARDATTQTISASAYYLDAAKETLIFDAVTFAHRVEIIYVAGYGDSTQVPKPIKLGVMAHIASMYDDRGQWENTQIPPQSLALYAGFRRVVL